MRTLPGSCLISDSSTAIIGGVTNAFSSDGASVTTARAQNNIPYLTRLYADVSRSRELPDNMTSRTPRSCKHKSVIKNEHDCTCGEV